jgi:hypothetical protein
LSNRSTSGESINVAIFNDLAVNRQLFVWLPEMAQADSDRQEQVRAYARAVGQFGGAPEGGDRRLERGGGLGSPLFQVDLPIEFPDDPGLREPLASGLHGRLRGGKIAQTQLQPSHPARRSRRLRRLSRRPAKCFYRGRKKGIRSERHFHRSALRFGRASTLETGRGAISGRLDVMAIKRDSV